MKRKIIQLANTTYVVSLPLKWVKAHGVRKKDEVEVAEEGRKITVSLLGEKEPLPVGTVIDVSGLGRRIAEWSIAAAYKRGFDEIKVFYKGDQIKFILNYVRDMLLGFFVTEQTEDYCVLKIVSRETGSEFNNLLRRAFLVGIELAESSLDLISKGKYDALADLLHLEKTNNQLTLTCQRLVRKGFISENPNELFLVAWHLENIVDDYRDMCIHLSTTEKPRVSKEILETYSEVNGYFRSYYDLFYSFNLKSLDDLDRKRDIIVKKISKMDGFVLNCLSSITRKLSVLSATIMSINLADKPEDF
ncbi:hypothetical protein HYU11_00520 [Candidatus Woesearchaeota archaeon]|nr:hypothetical protein [Candidatus Woesearchaeota archaeon]